MKQRAATRPIWDPIVRVFHWGLVASSAVAWFSADEWKAVHNGAGYFATALIGLRVIWGFAGTRYARFDQFVRSPRAVLNYIPAALQGREARYLGHNPAGSLMILALLSGVAALSLSGWLLSKDALWGSAALASIHEALAYFTLGLIAVHVLGVLFVSLHRVHHSIHPSETNSNFGFTLPWWDRLFGTYRAQPRDGHDHMEIGIDQFRSERDLRLDQMLVQPLRGKAGAYPINER